MPLFAVPVAAWLTTVSHRPVAAAAASMLMLIAARNGVEHALLNAKNTLTLREAGVSGWNPSLLFPGLSHDAPLFPPGPDLALLVVWSAVVVGAVVLGSRLGRQEFAARTSIRPGRLVGASLLALVVAGTIAIALGAPSRGPQFLFERPPLASAPAGTLPRDCWISRTTAVVPIPEP
jgi:hypothetical protein